MAQRIERWGSRREHGFTLIELLVVVVILAVLSSVVVAAAGGTGDKGQRAAYAADAKTVRNAQEAFCGRFGVYGTERQLAGLDPAPDGQLHRFLSEESQTHDVELGTGGPCGGTSYSVVSPVGYGGAPLPSGQQTMTVGFGADPWRTSKLRLSRFSLDAGTCETLTLVRNDYSVAPRLATRWELINPGNNAAYPGNPTWRFHLRSGVTFHNGTGFTAADVKYSMDRLVALGDDFTAKLGDRSTVVVNPFTVDITPAEANLRLPEILVHPTYAIIGKDTEPSTMPATPATVVCTGPFKFVRYAQDDRMVVERNDQYWGERARLQQLTFRFIPDSNTRRLALEAGTVDAIFDVPRQQVAGLRSRSGIRVVTAPTSFVFVVYENANGQPPYDKLRNRNIRRALALSIDRQDFIAQNWDAGTATVVQTPSPPFVLGSSASMIEGYAFDLAQARQLLASEGWVCTGADAPDCTTDEIRRKDGVPLDLYLLSNTSDDLALLQDVKARAAKAGINIVIGADGMNRATRKNEGRWDLDTSLPNQNDANPAFLLTLQWWSKSINPWVSCLGGRTPCGPWQQAGPQFDSLVEQALAAPDLAGAQSFSGRAMDLLVDQEALTIPLAGLSRVYGLKEGIEGFTPPHPAQSHVSWARVYRTR